MSHPPTLVLVGATGDLAKRKLLPALRALGRRGVLPFGRIIGTSRRPLPGDDIVPAPDPLRSIFETASLPDEPDAYRALAERLVALRGEVFFYLAVPPGSVPGIAARLAAAECEGTLVLEKPFGMDGASAQTEALRVAQAFSDKVVRVDHYLGKPLALRLADAAPARGAARLEVIAAEALGQEGRADFYDATGALRDMGNHVLSLACAALGAQTAAERLCELKQLTITGARRAQYAGYAEEVGHATETETFFTVELAHAAHPNLAIALVSGKALSAKQTVVRTPAAEFAEAPGDEDAYERLFAALVHTGRDLFLSEEEALESWRLIDAARQCWGELAHYPRGARPEDLHG